MIMAVVLAVCIAFALYSLLSALCLCYVFAVIGFLVMIKVPESSNLRPWLFLN